MKPVSLESNTLSNREYSVLEKNRFEKVGDLYYRYSAITDEVKNGKIHLAWENFTKAYNRESYMRKNGTSEPNFGDFHYRIERERSMFEDLALEREQWARITPIDAPNEETRKVWAEEISHWFHELCIRSWRKRVPNTIMDIFEMVMFSHGVEMWDGALGVYPESIPVENLFPDSNASMDPSEWDIVFYEKSYTLVELYDAVSNDSKAKRNGWNKQAVMEILKNADEAYNNYSSSEVLERFRNGGVENDCADKTITMIHAYVKEYKEVKGKRVSVYIFPASQHIPKSKTGKTDKDHLNEMDFACVKPHFFKCFTNIFAIRNHRTHRSYWGCPSTAQLIYVASKFHDQGINKAIRGAFRQLMLFLFSGDPDSQARLANLEDEEVHSMNPADKFEQFRLSVDISQLMEVLRQVSVETDAGTGTNAIPGSQNVKGSAITASEAQLIAATSQSDKSSDIRQFIYRDGQMVSEIYRRFVSNLNTEDDVEAKMYKRFVNKMAELGIPRDAYDFDNVFIEPVFSLNAGTAQQKIAVAQSKVAGIRQYSAATTDGERRAIREWIAALDSWANVDYYLSKMGTLEVSEKVKAGFENELLSNPNVKPANVVVTNDDKHNIHLPLHLNDMEASLTFAESLLMQLQNSVPAEAMIRLDEITDILVAQDYKGAHVEAHMRLLSQSPEEEGAIDRYSEMIGALRQKEALLEQATRAAREKILESIGNSSVSEEQLRHAKAMNAETERHMSVVNNIKLGERITKTQANIEGADERHQQDMRQKEEQAALKLAESQLKLAQKENEKENDNTQGTAQ
jgi:hypothetical protein